MNTFYSTTQARRVVAAGRIAYEYTVPSADFDRFAGLAALAAAVAGLLFSITFVITVDDGSRLMEGLNEALLLLGGVLSTPVLTALYLRLREVDLGFALWGLLLGLAGGIASAIHGGWDLVNVIENPPFLPSTPNPVDPRGLATFGLTAIAVGTLSWLILRSGFFPRRLGQLGLVAAVLLAYVYLGRLLVFGSDDPPLLVGAVLLGFVVNPLWYAWVGLLLWRGAAGRNPELVETR
jgi:hypothetical protein